jgi:DNA-binding transcriptional MerR regulator
VGNRIKISDFVKLTGSTLKTIIYYHKIGLLQEPERSPGGYRLYGATELERMQLIKHLKSLGLDLKRMKEVLGTIDDNKTLREVLQSLRSDLLSEKKKP